MDHGPPRRSGWSALRGSARLGRRRSRAGSGGAGRLATTTGSRTGAAWTACVGQRPQFGADAAGAVVEELGDPVGEHAAAAEATGVQAGLPRPHRAQVKSRYAGAVGAQRCLAGATPGSSRCDGSRRSHRRSHTRPRNSPSRSAVGPVWQDNGNPVRRGRCVARPRPRRPQREQVSIGRRPSDVAVGAFTRRAVSGAFGRSTGAGRPGRAVTGDRLARRHVGRVGDDQRRPGSTSKMSHSAASTGSDSRSGVPVTSRWTWDADSSMPRSANSGDQFGGGEQAVLGHQLPQPPLDS